MKNYKIIEQFTTTRTLYVHCDDDEDPYEYLPHGGEHLVHEEVDNYSINVLYPTEEEQLEHDISPPPALIATHPGGFPLVFTDPVWGAPINYQPLTWTSPPAGYFPPVGHVFSTNDHFSVTWSASNTAVAYPIGGEDEDDFNQEVQ